MSTSSTSDLIDDWVGIRPHDRLDQIRLKRLQARINAQQSHLALFEPAEPLAGHFALADRHAVAAFVAALHRNAELFDFHTQGVARHGGSQALITALAAEAEGASREAAYRASAAHAQVLGAKLPAALAHAHLLVFRPRDASPAALQALLDAGWSTTDIVTLSQLVSFLTFQIRVVAGLQVLAAGLAPNAIEAEEAARV